MKKSRGIYYTPGRLAGFVAQHAISYLPQRGALSVLEPSVGKGAFVRALSECSTSVPQRVDLTVVEIQQHALQQAVSYAAAGRPFRNVNAICGDFLTTREIDTGFSLVIGNPPYVKKNSLSAATLDACRRIYRRVHLPVTAVLNLWPAFVVESEQRLGDEGVMAFVLPADLLQVKYAECIREYLEKRFARIEVFALGVDAFDGIEQQTVLLFAIRKHQEKGTFFYRIEDYEKGQARRISSNGLMISQSKWTHFNLTTEEIKLVNGIAAECSRFGEMIHSRPGIVTGANGFFILREGDLRKRGACAYARPILRGARWVERGALISKEHFRACSDTGQPCYLLDLRKMRKNARLEQYIREGEAQGLHMGYKCSHRTPWYVVPNIGKQALAAFFKRSHVTPKLLRNAAGVHVTDAAYLLDAKPNFDLDSIIWSFYNPLTLIYAELTGRSYGGGVLELTPNELRDLPVPYCKVKAATFNAFNSVLVFNERSAAFLTQKVRIRQLGVSRTVYTDLCGIYRRLVSHRVSSKNLRKR